MVRKKLIVGSNDLLSVNPDIAREADGWDPSGVLAGFGSKKPWRCERDHKWTASVAHRAMRGDSCPYCSGRRVLPGFNDLATSDPQLSTQAHEWDPSTVTRGSHKVVDWRCELGHVWSATPNQRTNTGSGCPVCANQQVRAGYNDLATTHPEIAQQADGWDPSAILAGTNRKLAWICSHGHSWDASVNQRTNQGTGCPVCAGKKVLIGFNDLATHFPELARQAVGWDAATYTPGSHAKVNWRCDLGHEWIMPIGARTGQSQGCPVCSGNRVLAGFNDLATRFPDIVHQAVGWDPSTYTWGSNAKVRWRCDLGHEWIMPIGARTGQSQGCPVCSGRQIVVGFNDLASRFPEMAAEANGWDPSAVVSNTNKKLSWICSKKHTWTTSPNARVSNGTGCPYCSGNRVFPGFNDLLTTHPELASQAVGWDPKAVIAGSHKRLRWKCDNGHEWVAVVGSRTGLGAGCPICSGFKTLPGYNDLASTYPELAREAIGWNPTQVSAGTMKKYRWRCDLGHEWTASVKNRTSLESGCPSCSLSGFDPNKDGYLYFLEHQDWGLLQIGITNVPQQRVAQHGKSGWTVIQVRGPMSGDVTRGWEQSIMQSLRTRGVKLGPQHIAGRFDGYTESWARREFKARSLEDLMNLVHEDEA